MSNISLEQIDLIMQRANVTYSEAKEALEQCNGDTVEALLLLEKANKVKPNASFSKTNLNDKGQGFKAFLKKLHTTTFTLTKNERTYLDLPLTITILGAVVCCPFSILALVIAIAYGMKVNISGETDIAKKVNETINDFKK